MIFRWGRSTVKAETDIAIFGGSFDPISLHHEGVARTISVLGYSVWFMPCYQHKYGKELAEPRHRLHMCRLVTNKVPNWHTSDFEIGNELTGYFYENLLYLKTAYPEYRFHPVIGTDNANDIAAGKWGRSKELIAENPMIVVERGDHPLQTDWCLKGDHKYFSHGVTGQARDIRDAIKEGDANFAIKRLDPDVWAYIQSEGLYQ